MLKVYSNVLTLALTTYIIRHIETNKPEKKMNLLEKMVNSIKEKLLFAYELKGTREAAIEYVKTKTTGGPKAWDIALSDLGWK